VADDFGNNTLRSLDGGQRGVSPIKDAASTSGVKHTFKCLLQDNLDSKPKQRGLMNAKQISMVPNLNTVAEIPPFPAELEGSR
jgi:hypothetical protein